MDQQTPTEHDPIQLNLDAVTRRLHRPAFLSNLTPSRLPSRAASDSSLSPGEAPNAPHHAEARFSQRGHSHLNVVTFEDGVVDADLVSPLLQEPAVDGSAPGLDQYVLDHLNSQFVGARSAYNRMASERNFQSFAHGHHDLVLAVDFNYFGTRMVTASSDHRLKVWDKKDETWSLVESWRAHDAEIVDVSGTTYQSLVLPGRGPGTCTTILPPRLTSRQVKWNGPFMGEAIGSIGEDGRCKLWQEDVTEVPMSGNRFKLITNLASQTNAPFMSLDFKNIMQETWLALITRDGLLQVYEPTDQSNLNEWSILAEHWVCGNNPPERQEEVGFKVAFHKEKLPCWTAIMAGLDRKSLGLAVAAMNKVLVFRTDKTKRFFLVAELKEARQIIRDVAWANGSMRGYDVLATASKDGAIRIYELSTPRPDKPSATGASSASTVTDTISSPQINKSRKNAPSGIGAGLAGASKGPEPAQDNEQYPGRIRQEYKLVDELTKHHGAVWRLAFSQMGMSNRFEVIR